MITLGERAAGWFARHLARELENRLPRPIVNPPPPPPAPFVSVLVLGDALQRQESPQRLARVLAPTSLGGGGRIHGGGEVFVVRPQVPIENGRVFVFADLALVEVRGIYVGTDPATACLGECPMAYFARCDPGQEIRVDCRVRA